MSLTAVPPQGAGRPSAHLDTLAPLYDVVDAHSIWQNPLFWACKRGYLSRSDLAGVFGQYAHYSNVFTRGLAAFMANCEDDLLRARLMANLWDEGGGAKPEERHTELFRSFLSHLGVNPRVPTAPIPATQRFVGEWLRCAGQPDALAAAAHLSLGTEYIVARMYRILVQGLEAAGLPEGALTFFHVHMACDDAHAHTLEEILLHLAEETGPTWGTRARQALVSALDAREAFFYALYDDVVARRLAPTLGAIQSKVSLAEVEPDMTALCLPKGSAGRMGYENTVPSLGIDFQVEHLPFRPEVLDPRRVHIPPGKRNECHRHAHETLYYIEAGRGRVAINDGRAEVGPGDLVFIPRWALHQTENIGDVPLVILALTDFHLTSKAFVGNYLKTARMKADAAE